MYPPLQSHGLMVKKWVPPKATRFISYTKSDESWAAYCGLGHYVQELAPWYDVMHEDGKSCLGWTKYDPTSIGITGRLAFKVTEKIPVRFGRERPERYVSATYTTIEMQRRTWCRQSRLPGLGRERPRGKDDRRTSKANRVAVFLE
jgi:hypothetical protein